MDLIITLRKEVETEEIAENIYNLVKTRMEDYPDVQINAHTSKRLTENPN